MRIVVDGCCLANGRGYGRYTREMLRNMIAISPGDEWVCVMDGASSEKLGVTAPNLRVVTVEQSQAPSMAAAAEGYRSPLDMLRLTRAVWREKPDVFFCPSVYSYYPLPPGTAAVITIHDAIAERFPELTMPSRRARFFWNAKVWLAIQQASLLLTVSDYSADQIKSYLKVRPDRIRVATEAPAASYSPSDSAEQIEKVAAQQGLPAGARWFTYVGGFNPHKRIDLILRAHATIVNRMIARGETAPYLVLVGTRTADVFYSEARLLDELIADLGTSEWVKWAGWVADTELRHLHSGAVALLLPSEAEGFGLPAVEAAACDTPVVATLESPLPQLLAGGGLWVSPGNEQSLERAMSELLADEPKRLALGRIAGERARALSWARSAAITMDVLREAAA